MRRRFALILRTYRDAARRMRDVRERPASGKIFGRLFQAPRSGFLRAQHTSLRLVSQCEELRHLAVQFSWPVRLMRSMHGTEPGESRGMNLPQFRGHLQASGKNLCAQEARQICVHFKTDC